MKKQLFILLLTITVGASMIGCGAKDEIVAPPDDNTQIEDTITDGAIEGEQDENTSDDAENDDTTQKPADKPTSGSPATKPDSKPSSKPDNKPDSGANKPSSGGSTNNSNAALSGKFEDILAGIYKTAGITDLKTGNTALTAENMAYYLGVDNLKIKQGLGSEPMMSSIAHSVVLIELEAGQDVSKAKTAIKDNVDGRKWICVGVEDEDILVDNIGNFILLVMDENPQSIMDAFKALAK